MAAAEGSDPFPTPLAGWGRRALAALVDLSPVVLVVVMARGWLGMTLVAAYVYLLGHLDGVSGQTPGKAIVGLKLVDSRGSVIGGPAGVGRKVLHGLDLLPAGLGFLLPLVHVRRQTVADRIMSTYVIDGVEPRPVSPALWVPPRSH